MTSSITFFWGKGFLIYFERQIYLQLIETTDRIAPLNSIWLGFSHILFFPSHPYNYKLRIKIRVFSSFYSSWGRENPRNSSACRQDYFWSQNYFWKLDMIIRNCLECDSQGEIVRVGREWVKSRNSFMTPRVPRPLEEPSKYSRTAKIFNHESILQKF